MNAELEKILERKSGKGRPLYVAVLGVKGGSRKTTTAIMLAQGATLKGKKVVLLSTDSQLIPDRRMYAEIDMSNLAKAPKVFENIENNKDKIDLVVIDGGSNREEFDKHMSKIVDVIIIPTTIDDKSTNEARQYLEKYKNTFVIPTGYSYQWMVKRTKRQQNAVREMLGEQQTKIVAEIDHIDQADLLASRSALTFPRDINNACKRLYVDLLGNYEK